jgi:hypothetical protein
MKLGKRQKEEGEEVEKEKKKLHLQAGCGLLTVVLYNVLHH